MLQLPQIFPNRISLFSRSREDLEEGGTPIQSNANFLSRFVCLPKKEFSIDKYMKTLVKYVALEVYFFSTYIH